MPIIFIINTFFMKYTDAVSHCGHDHSQWLKSLEFYDDDLDSLENRLLEIVKKNNGYEAMKGVEHFQNQFMIQRKNIHDLRHTINRHSGKVAAEALSHVGKMEMIRVDEHENIKAEVENFEKIINELRHEFNVFLSKWM
ncbi:MAG: hypothetical protein HOP10_05330 [Chitinophagaceae bacterium]|nr:hypothetical protein [Chitinophagaceae bacterium]